MTQYGQPKRSSGRLFPRPPEGNKPTWTGDLTLTPELIQEINQMASRGEVRLRLACWPKQSQRPGGGEYLSVNAEMDRIQPGDQPQPRQFGGPRPPQQGGYQRQTPQAQPVRGGHFQTPARPARQQPVQPSEDFPFDDSPDFNTPWRK